MTPEISVVIPTYARPLLLRRAVESVVDQTMQDFEILVVDDASPDPVALPRHPRLRVLNRNERGGTAAARNTAIREARGRLVAFLDDDDYYLENRLGIAVERSDIADVSVCWARSSNPSDRRAGWTGQLEGAVNDTILNRRVPPIGTCTVFRVATPFFDERFTSSEDVEWWLRLAQQEVRFATVRKELYIVGAHTGTRKTGHVEDRLRCRLMLLKEHTRYFADHPHAAAQQWKRAGGMAYTLSDYRTARTSLWRALKISPDLSVAFHLGRSLVRSVLPPSGVRRQ